MTSRALTLAALASALLAASPTGAQTAPTMTVKPKGEAVEVCITAQNRAEAVKDSVELLVDGVRIPSILRAVINEDGEECPKTSSFFAFDLNPGPNKLEAVAYASDGSKVQAGRDTVRLTVEGPRGENVLHVLTIGIDSYPSSVGSLSYADDDARAFAQFLRTHALQFKDTRVEALYNGEATKQAIDNAFSEIGGRMGPNDAFVFFYAGHGAVAEWNGTDRFFLATAGVTDLADGKHLKNVGIIAADLQTMLSGIPGNLKLLVLDACNSAAMSAYLHGKDANTGGVLSEVGSTTAILAAAQSSQAASAVAPLGHGLFTAALLAPRSSGGRPRSRNIAYLYNHITESLPALAKQFSVESQDPFMKVPPNFALIIR